MQHRKNKSKAVHTTHKNKAQNKTRKNRGDRSNKSSIEQFERQIVLNFLCMLNTIKIYHWKTRDYAVHKATDELYSRLNENIDKFVEVLLGKMGNRVDFNSKLGIKCIPFHEFTSLDQLKRDVAKYKNYLVDLNSNKVMNMMANYDLFTIRDEILADLNQFLYLLTLQ